MRFCKGAESCYSPICGEAAAAAWGVEKNKLFLLCLPNYTLCLDHNPLIKIFSPSRELGKITNPRLYKQKVKLLPFRFAPHYVPGEEHVTSDCFSRRSDYTGLDQGPAEKIDLLVIANVKAEYSTSLSLPCWVLKPGLMASLISHPISQPQYNHTKNTFLVEALMSSAARSSLDKD